MAQFLVTYFDCSVMPLNVLSLFCQVMFCFLPKLSSNVLLLDQTVSNGVAVALAVTVTVLVPVDLAVAVGIGFGVSIPTHQDS